MDGQSKAPSVAIIGGGWSGLQTLQSLKELNVSAEIFEKRSNVGGTWTPDMSYHNLEVHSPMYTNTMTCNGQVFPFKGMDKTSLLLKKDAKFVNEYLNDFADRLELRPMIHCNTMVKEIRYHSKSSEAYVLVESNGEVVEKGPYQLVVFASLSASKSMPDIPVDGFTGKVIHSCELKDDVIKEILQKEQQVLVLGAGKSGCDMALAFQRHSYKQVTWLMRSPYWFINYETVNHGCESVLGMLRSFLLLLSLLLWLIYSPLAVFVNWLTGAMVMPGHKGKWPSHFNGHKFHFGVLDPKQLSFLQDLMVKCGEPQKLSKKGMLLASGETVDCDVVIYATGYETGFGDIKLMKDGEALDGGDVPLYHHAVVPNFPCLMVAPTAFYQFGPCRGLTMAQYITYYLEARPSEGVMMKSAKNNWCVQSATKFSGFKSNKAFVEQFLLMYLDFWKNGIVSLATVFNCMLKLFVFAKMIPLELTVGQMPKFP